MGRACHCRREKALEIYESKGKGPPPPRHRAPESWDEGAQERVKNKKSHHVGARWKQML